MLAGGAKGGDHGSFEAKNQVTLAVFWGIDARGDYQRGNARFQI